MSKRRYIQNLRSQTIIDNNGGKKPKLPEANDIKEGEIAINFATGYETIAIKNADGEIVKFDNKVDENYEQTQYNGKFETLITETNHVKAGDTNSKAFKSVENTMSTLVDEVYKNEKAIVTTFGTVGSATGIVDAEGNISYQTKADAHYIAPATSVHKATVLLDNSLNRVETTVNEHQNQITAVKATADQNKTDVRNIATAAGVINEQNVIGYQKDTDANYIIPATSVHEATMLLDRTLGRVDTKVAEITGATGLSVFQGQIRYPQSTNTRYINEAKSVHEATLILDGIVSNNENSILANENLITEISENVERINEVISKFPSIQYVDLGLPSGTLWLTCNLGANRPTGIGNYYMWGSLSPNDKTNCIWSNTPFNDGQTTQNDTVFNTATSGTKNIVLYQNRLNEAFDVIYHRTHGIAKLPTEEQINELISDTNTTMEWVTKYQGITVNGFTFTSKTNNKVLFIPAGGFINGIKTLQKGKTMYVMSSNIEDSSHKIITLRGYNSGLSGGIITMPEKNTLERNQAIPLRGVIV